MISSGRRRSRCWLLASPKLKGCFPNYSAAVPETLGYMALDACRIHRLHHVSLQLACCFRMEIREPISRELSRLPVQSDEVFIPRSAAVGRSGGNSFFLCLLRRAITSDQFVWRGGGRFRLFQFG